MEQLRTYSIDRPQEMILKQAPKAGAEAQRIWQQGVFDKQPSLSLDREAGLEEAIRNSFSFVQLYGMKAGESDQLACISAGLPWDRQRPMEQTATQIVDQILGGKGQLRWFGPHKLVGFLEAGESEDEMLGRFVNVPRDAYRENFPNLSQAVNDLQDLRAEEVLSPRGANGDKFKNISAGDQRALTRAYQDDNQHTFAWGYKKDQTGELWGINLDNQPQSMTSLALESPDQETTDMLLAIQDYFRGGHRLNRYVVEFDFSATVSCCNISFNAQQARLITEVKNIFSEESLVIAEKKDLCKYCQKELDPKEKSDTCQSCVIKA